MNELVRNELRKYYILGKKTFWWHEMDVDISLQDLRDILDDGIIACMDDQEWEYYITPKGIEEIFND